MGIKTKPNDFTPPSAWPWRVAAVVGPEVGGHCDINRLGQLPGKLNRESGHLISGAALLPIVRQATAVTVSFFNYAQPHDKALEHSALGLLMCAEELDPEARVLALRLGSHRTADTVASSDLLDALPKQDEYVHWLDTERRRFWNSDIWRQVLDVSSNDGPAVELPLPRGGQVLTNPLDS